MQSATLTFGAFEYVPHTAPVVSNMTAVKDGNNVTLTYTVTDTESDAVTLASPMYSTTGVWSGEEHPASFTVTDVVSSSLGETHTVQWNASGDLGATSIPTVYIRVTPSDAFSTGEATVFGPFSFDFTPIGVISDAQPNPIATGESAQTIIETQKNKEEKTETKKVAEEVVKQTPQESTQAPESTTVSLMTPVSKKSIAVAAQLKVIRQVEEAKVSPMLKAPVINAVAQVGVDDDVTFTGTGIPNSTVTLFIHSSQMVFYTTRVLPDGTWNIVHAQHDIELAPGAHTAYAMTYDPYSAVRSVPTEAFGFAVESNNVARLLSYVDIRLTLGTFAILILVLLVLTRYDKVRTHRRTHAK